MDVDREISTNRDRLKTRERYEPRELLGLYNSGGASVDKEEHGEQDQEER
jgi:hypothetical protein